MARKGHSSFWTTGIWVMVRYLALPIMILAAIYTLGGPTQRAKIHGRIAAIGTPVQERMADLVGRSEFLSTRIHLKEPEIAANTSIVRLSDLPVAAIVPVVNLNDLPEIEGTTRVHLRDLPPPIEDTVVFLKTLPPPVLAVPKSIRPRLRPDSVPASET